MNKIIVCGSINMDIITRVSKLPMIGESISGKYVEYLPGGKGLNQAVASAKMGAETILVGRLGNDVLAQSLADFINQHHINTQYLQKSHRESGTAFITVADNGQNTIVVVAGSNAEFVAEDVSSVEINKGDIVISQFEIPVATILAVFERAKTVGAKTILNPSPIQKISENLLSKTDILIVNETELGFLKNEKITAKTSMEEVIKTAQQVKINEEQTIIVTLGHQGALVVEKTAYLIEGHEVEAIDTVGAGDCFSGVFASQFLNNKSLKESVQIANKAASICVTRKGAAPSMPDAGEVLI